MRLISPVDFQITSLTVSQLIYKLFPIVLIEVTVTRKSGSLLLKDNLCKKLFTLFVLCYVFMNEFSIGEFTIYLKEEIKLLVIFCTLEVQE